MLTRTTEIEKEKKKSKVLGNSDADVHRSRWYVANAHVEMWGA